jgi:Amino acid transporters
VQTALTIAKIAAIGVLLVLLFGTGPLHMPASLGTIQPRGFLRALVAGLFAFGGWHMVTYAAEETQNPERIIPRALMLGTAVVVVTYLALNSAYLLVLPFDAVLKSTHIAFDATLATAGPRAASAISILVIVSSFGRSAASSWPDHASTMRWPRTGCCSSGWDRCIPGTRHRISRSSFKACGRRSSS